ARRAFAAIPARADAEHVLIETLESLAVEPARWEELLDATAQPLRGWAGMVRRLEEQPELAPHECPPCRLADFLAVRLLLAELAARRIAREELGHHGAAHALLQRLGSARPGAVEPRRREAFALFQAAQLAGVSAPALRSLSAVELEAARAELVAFDELA